jgi:hypothetical protein
VDKVANKVFNSVFSIFNVVREVFHLANEINHFVRLLDGTADAENGVAGIVCDTVCAADDAADGAD